MKIHPEQFYQLLTSYFVVLWDFFILWDMFNVLLSVLDAVFCMLNQLLIENQAVAFYR